MHFVAFVTQCSPAFNDSAHLRGPETSREWDSAPSYASPCLRPVRTFGQCGWYHASSVPASLYKWNREAKSNDLTFYFYYCPAVRRSGEGWSSVLRTKL